MGGKASIILVAGFTFITGYVFVNLSKASDRAAENMAYYNKINVSHNLALAGANVALAEFYRDTTWRGPLTQTDANNNMSGTFTVRIVRLPDTRLCLKSISTYSMSMTRNIHDTVEVYFNPARANSFSIFAWMTDNENNVTWISRDTVWGRVHSNDNLKVNGSPVYFDKVTTAKNFNPRVGSGVNHAVFNNGFETGVSRIDFPTDFSGLIGAADSGGARYNSDIWLKLFPGAAGDTAGFAVVRNSSAGPPIDTVRLNRPGFKGVILGNNKVHVEGTLNGQLSVVSLTHMYIENDILYSNNPMSGHSTDVLGLIAEQNIYVANNAQNNNGCTIQASLFSRSGSFAAEDYSTRGVAGELRVLGSIVQKTRGAVGTFNAGSGTPVITSGFSKRYRYDPRLADTNFRPPYYPSFWNRTLSISDWWESYRNLESDQNYELGL